MELKIRWIWYSTFWKLQIGGIINFRCRNFWMGFLRFTFRRTFCIKWYFNHKCFKMASMYRSLALSFIFHQKKRRERIKGFEHQWRSRSLFETFRKCNQVWKTSAFWIGRRRIRSNSRPYLREKLCFKGWCQIFKTWRKWNWIQPWFHIVFHYKIIKS